MPTEGWGRGGREGVRGGREGGEGAYAVVVVAGGVPTEVGKGGEGVEE